MRIFPSSHSLISLFLLTTIVLLPVCNLHAQDPVTGAIEGYVFDSASRAPVPGVLVQIVNIESGAVLAKRTNAQGYYRQGLLPPGEYRIRASMEGYTAPADQVFTNYATRPNEVRPPIYLAREAAIVATATPEPSPGAAPPTGAPSPVTQPQTSLPPTTSSVTGNIANEMNLTDARRGGAYTDKEVSTLPLGGMTLTRSFDELGLLVPGVAPPPETQGSVAGPGVGPGVGSAGQFAVNGFRSRANNFTVDGSDNNDEDIGVRRQGFFALIPQPIESVKEFQITTLLAPAQYGRNFGAQVNALSKSGGNEFHGTIFGLFNSSQLNARNFFDTTSGNGTTNVTARTVVNNQSFTQSVLLDGRPLTVANQSGREDSLTLGQGGFVLGGPIKKGKTFFFVSYENQVLNATREESFAVPTVEQRGIFNTGATGIFADCLTPLNAGFNVTNCTPTNRANFYPEAGFPTSLAGDSVMSFFPFPNNPNSVFGINTYTEILPASARGNVLSGKVDENFSLRGKPQTLTARYNFTQDWREIPVTGGALFSALKPRVRTQNFSTFFNSEITSKTSNVLRLSYGRTRLVFDEVRDPFLIPSQVSPNQPFLLNARRLLNDTLTPGLGSPNTGSVIYDTFGTSECGVLSISACAASSGAAGGGIGRIGQINIAGFSPIGVDVFNFPQRRVNNTYQVADTLGYLLGKHGLTFGTDIRRVELNSDLPRNSRTLLSYNGAPEFCNDSTCTGLFSGNFVAGIDFAAAGAPSGAFLSLANGVGSGIGLRYHEFNFFGQDEWRIRRNLSLNLGLRYEYNTPPREAHSIIENSFSASALSNANAAGLRTFLAGRTTIFDPDRNNFEPRVSLAWSPSWFGQDRSTVIRAGFGIFHDQILGAVVSQSRNVFPNFITVNTGGFGANNTLDIINFFNPAYGGITHPGFDPLVQPGTLNSLNPALALALVLDCLAGNGTGTCSAPFLNSLSITLPDRRLKTPSAEQYGLTFEQQLSPNLLLSIGFVSTRGHNLLRASTPNLGPNNLVLPYASFAANDLAFCLDPSVDDCRQPQFGAGVFAPGFTRPQANAGPVHIYDSGGRSRYDALQIQLRGRFRQGLQYQANYTFGKTKDDASDMFDLAGAAALPQNSLSRAGEYALSNFDARHRVAYNLIFDFPKGANKGGSYRAIFGGLQIASAGSFQTGQPFTVNSIFDVNLDGNLTDRLNTTSGIITTGDRRQPIALQSGTNPRSLLAPVSQDGALGRNTFRAGNILNLDMAVIKNFSFSETRRLTFRMDIFNFINRANFGIPVRFLEEPGFGQATSTVTPGRRIQLGLKFSF
jgi:hypothetical protein